MVSATKTCKICGAEYPYCKTERSAGTFRWQDVACCPDHGEVYLRKVLASRATGVNTTEARVDPYMEAHAETTVVEREENDASMQKQRKYKNKKIDSNHTE